MKLSVKKTAVIGILSALSFALMQMNIGIIDLKIIGLPFQVTILHLTVIIAALMEGLVPGMLVGFFFGIFSIAYGFMKSDPMLPIVVNPLVSVLPRILIGASTYYVYKLLKPTPEYIRVACAAIAGTLTNTIGFLGMIYLLYSPLLSQIYKIPLENIGVFLLGIVITNALPETIVAVLVCVLVIPPLKKAVEGMTRSKS